MSKFTLDDIFNSVSIPLEADGLSFRLVPMGSRAISAWNRVLFTRPAEDATMEDRLDHAETQREKQLQLIADHMRTCLTDGGKAKVTAKWVGEVFPQVVLQQFAEYFVEGTRPAWAAGGAEGN